MENVVQPFELAGAFEREDVERLLDDAQPGGVAPGIRTDRADRPVADVEAAIAEDDLLADGYQGRRQGSGFRVRGAQQVICQPLGRLGADTGQAGEGFDEPGDRLDQRRGHVLATSRAVAARR